MTSRIFGLRGALAAVALVAACKKDPTAADVGTPKSLAFELDAKTVAVADSFRTFVVLRDALGTPLATPVNVASCNSAVATVLPASDAPQVRTAFFVKGVAYSATSVCIIATASGFTDSMLVTTRPGSISMAGGPANDTLPSGTTTAYTYTYNDAANTAMTGVPAPTFSSGDTTIAQLGSTLGQVAGRAPGLTVISVSGAGGVSANKTVTIIPVAFTGTTTSPVLPGAKLVIKRDPATAFDANTAISIGTIATADKFYPDSFRIRISDLSGAGSHSFTLTGVGAGDVAYKGSYTTATPPAFTGTFNPATAQAGFPIAIIRNPADPPFDSLTNKFFRGGSVAGLAAVTPVSGSVTADSFKLSTTDLSDSGTYYVQVTRLGATTLAWRGTYRLPTGVWGGTIAPGSGIPASKVVLHRGGGDPMFTSSSRVFIGGIRAFIDTSSTDSAVIAVPPLGANGAADLRISRMAGNAAVDGSGVFNSLTSSLLDSYGYSNNQPNFPVALPGDGNYYMTLSGACPNGVPGNGQEVCDHYFTITNNSATIPDTVFVRANWFAGATDADLLICDGTALATGGVPACGNFAGGADIFDCACSYRVGDGFALDTAKSTEGPPERITFALPPKKTYLIWVNMFDPGGAPATLIQLKVKGIK
jgi:hypothetical protein